MFDNIKPYLIEEKISFFRNLRMNKKELIKLEEMIIDNRLGWFRKNRDYLINKIEIKNLQEDLKKVHYLIFNLWLSARFCNPKDNEFSTLYTKERKLKIIEIKTRNFCSYLEAFKLFGFNSNKCSYLCEKVLERPIQVMIDTFLKEIGSENKIILSRNYSYLRPKKDYCLERLSLVE